jgi:hypothetical protein
VPPFDPVALAGQLGAPVAVLVMPSSLVQVGGVEAEQVHQFGPSPQLPICAQTRYRFDSADFFQPAPVTALVWTRRPRPELPPVDLAEHVRRTLERYQLDSAGTAGASWIGRPSRWPPDAAAKHAQLAAALTGWQPRDVHVDGEPNRWEYIHTRDLTTEEDVLAYGAQLDQRHDNVMVAVVGPAHLLHSSIAIEMAHPQ